MAKGVGGELWKVGRQRQLADDFRPGPEGNGLRKIPRRLGEEQRTSCVCDGSPMGQIGSQQFAGGGRVGDDALSAPFGYLGSDTHHAMSWIEIGALQRAHFFASQPCIVGQGSHTARSQRSLLDHSQEGPPLLIARNPGQGLETRYQCPFAISSKRTCQACIFRDQQGDRFGVPPQ